MDSLVTNHVLMIIIGVILSWKSVEAFGTYGYDIHHRYSDSLKGILDFDGLPEKGSYDYYASMARRDSVARRRHLADNTQLLSFVDGNETYRLPSLGFLHYANVSVGTPSVWFLVALDTGSDLFWLPCDCVSCVRDLKTRSGRQIEFNIYSPNISSTSTSVLCDNDLCEKKSRCSAASDTCPYRVRYLSSNTSSSGFLVGDVLHLNTDDNQQKAVEANIKFGCGTVQTGSFLDGAAPNGLFGLGMEKVSVPSILASEGLAADSFSMCFGPDGTGRIKFGDKGSSDQSETPFNIDQLNPTYNISITHISVEENVTDVNLSAIFDSGTSFTYLTDPAFTIISENFNSIAQEKRVSPNSDLPFEYCYALSPKQDSFRVANVNLTTKGGKQIFVNDPIVYISTQAGAVIYCLGLVKSEDIDIIGQNFMTGYNIVFDRQKKVLGWKASDCYDGNNSAALPINPSRGAPPPAKPTPATNPPTSVEPEARSGNRTGSPNASPIQPQPTLPSNHSARSSSFRHALLMVFCSLVSHYLTILFF